ncbi:hypothetical protein D3C77_458990 [compost metagenome]
MPKWRQVDRVAFDRRYQPLAFDACLCGAHLASAPVGHRAVFVQAHAHAFHGAGQATHQFGRLDGGDIGIENGAVGFADTQLGGQLRRAHPAVVGFGQALLVEFVEVAAQGGFLLRVACRAIQHAAFAVVAVDAFERQYTLHFIGNAM